MQSELDLPAGYEMQWGGQFENLSRAQERLQIVVPAAVFIVFGMLYLTFRRLSYAIAVFVTVPLSFAAGVLGLGLRDMPFSLSAAVGFIALGGIAVLNGVVMGQEVLERRSQGHSPEDAVISGCVAVVKAILTTTAVAALGFLPMALSHGAGAEVQRPLATAVAVGIALGSMIALLVLPGIFMWMIGSKSERVAAPDTRDAEDSRG